MVKVNELDIDSLVKTKDYLAECSNVKSKAKVVGQYEKLRPY